MKLDGWSAALVAISSVLTVAFVGARLLSTNYEHSDLYLAAQIGDSSAIKQILNQHEHVNLFPNGVSVVPAAIRSNDFESFLLLANAYPTATMNEEDWLGVAIFERNDRVFDYCLTRQNLGKTLVHPAFHSVYAQNLYSFRKSLDVAFSPSTTRVSGQSLEDVLREKPWKIGEKLYFEWLKRQREAGRLGFVDDLGRQ